ncbi:MAG TPA: hypothetical protein VGI10_02175 [Polyangiaceae bacterium]
MGTPNDLAEIMLDRRFRPTAWPTLWPTSWARNEVGGQGRERLADRGAQLLGRADVALRRAELAVPGALLHAQGLRTRERFPRDAGRAQIVEGHALGGRALLVQIGAAHVRAPQVIAQRRGQVFKRWHAPGGLTVHVRLGRHDAAHATLGP